MSTCEPSRSSTSRNRVAVSWMASARSRVFAPELVLMELDLVPMSMLDAGEEVSLLPPVSWLRVGRLPGVVSSFSRDALLRCSSVWSGESPCTSTPPIARPFPIVGADGLPVAIVVGDASLRVLVPGRRPTRSRHNAVLHPATVPVGKGEHCSVSISEAGGASRLSQPGGKSTEPLYGGRTAPAARASSRPAPRVVLLATEPPPPRELAQAHSLARPATPRPDMQRGDRAIQAPSEERTAAAT
eukprot:scaffold1636_cov239-Prasinococcus_capsulatus_cf.AAC.5